MDTLHQLLCNAQLLPHLPNLLPKGQRCYLVGGILRDWLTGKPVTDFDLATPEDPTSLAKGFARSIGGHWFMLDKTRRQSRVVLRREGELTFDFAPFRGPDLQADLKGRDFTLNALALDLTGPLEEGRIFDPLQGRKDLALGKLRACSDSSFSDDPLRVLRGIRLVTTLGYHLEDQTLQLMRQAVEKVSQVAPERVRTELALIFSSAQGHYGLKLLFTPGLIETIFGPSPFGLNLTPGLVETVNLENGLVRLSQEDTSGGIGNLFAAEFEDGFSRVGFLKLCAFLRGYQPQDLEALSNKQLRLSRSNARSLACLYQLEPDLLLSLTTLPDRQRSRALWAEGLGPSPVDCLLFLGALVHPGKVKVELLAQVLADYLSLSAQGRIPDLLDGRQVAKLLVIPPGPLLGAALENVRQQEILGQISTDKDARKLLLKWANKNVDKGQGPPYNPDLN